MNDSLPPIELPPRYRVGTMIGRGAFGAVLSAHDAELGREVAIKVLLGGDASEVARFETEARKGAAVSHPCLLHILDAGRARGGEHYVVMERLVGETLGDRIAAKRLLGGPEAARILEDLLGALRALEARRMVHRDVKPSNVFLAELPGGDRMTKLIDFGLAKLLEADVPLTGRGMIVGSPGYLAPERYQGAEASAETDLYALGATLFEALTGEPPFTGESPAIVMAQVLTQPVPMLAARRPDLDPELAARVQALLDASPAVRRGAAEASRLATIEVRPTSRPAPAKPTLLDGTDLPSAAAPLGLAPPEAPAVSGARADSRVTDSRVTGARVTGELVTGAVDLDRTLFEPHAARAAQETELEALTERYTLLRCIGAGGMGVVYEARDRALDRPVALKLLRAEGPITDEQIERLEREARTAARLGHPNIVAVTDFGRVQGRGAFLVMELLSGESLAARLARKGRLEAREVIDVALQVLDALAVAHRAGVVHRDLKPENIHLVPLANGTRLAKLLDFGIVKLRESPHAKRLTERGMIVGTPAYMAPEQVELKEVDARTDVWAMGATLYQMLSGTLPYDGATPQLVVGAILGGPPPPLAARVPGLDPRLVAVVERAMSREPSTRFADAGAMRDALHAIDPRPVATMLPTSVATSVTSARSPDDVETRAVKATPGSTKGAAAPARAIPASTTALRAPTNDVRLVAAVVVIALVVLGVALAMWRGSSPPPVPEPSPPTTSPSPPTTLPSPPTTLPTPPTTSPSAPTTLPSAPTTSPSPPTTLPSPPTTSPSPPTTLPSPEATAPGPAPSTGTRPPGRRPPASTTPAPPATTPAPPATTPAPPATGRRTVDGFIDPFTEP